MTQPPIDEDSFSADFGLSRWRTRQIDDLSTDPRMVIARLAARRRGFTDIPPGIWAEAGATVRELRAARLLVDRREARNKNATKEKT